MVSSCDHSDLGGTGGMAELDVSVLKSRERGSGEMEERVETTSDSAIAHEHSEYVTAVEGGMQSSTCTTSAEERRAYGVWLEQLQRQCRSDEEFMTASSKSTWTQMDPLSSCWAEGSSACMLPAEKREIRVMNQQFFSELMKSQRPTRRRAWECWDSTYRSELDMILHSSNFFMDLEGRLEVGKKIAEGGQAEIHETLFDGKNAMFYGDSLVLKVFPLEHSEWFTESKNTYYQYEGLRRAQTCCFVMNCTLLKDGRFAFLMRRYWGDLRKAINEQIVKDKMHLNPPFPPAISTYIMCQIALGMRTLHAQGTLHRDLKAANVLVTDDMGEPMSQLRLPVFHVADFECAERVMGTGFWRAPEVLSVLRSSREDKYSDPTIWTKKVDVYAYAMTCYEVLSGCIPFQFRGASEYNIGDERPPLPDYVDHEIQELLRKCWDSEPLKRPTFQNISDTLLRFIEKKREFCKALARDERDDDAKRWLKLSISSVDWHFRGI